MPNSETWRPTKAEMHAGAWRASRNTAEVGHGSRIVADLLIRAYELHLKTHARGMLVDLGCGKAPYFGMYRGLVSRSVGVDWGSGAHGSEQVDVVSDLNAGIALADSVADTVLCTDVFEHIFKPAQLWSEIQRILKPGGTAIVGVPFFYWIHEAPYDFHRYTAFALRRYVEGAELSLSSIEAVGGLPHVIADLLCKAANAKGFAGVVEPACRAALKLSAGSTPPTTPFPLAYVLVAKKD